MLKMYCVHASRDALLGHCSISSSYMNFIADTILRKSQVVLGFFQSRFFIHAKTTHQETFAQFAFWSLLTSWDNLQTSCYLPRCQQRPLCSLLSFSMSMHIPRAVPLNLCVQQPKMNPWLPWTEQLYSPPWLSGRDTLQKNRWEVWK